MIDVILPVCGITTRLRVTSKDQLTTNHDGSLHVRGEGYLVGYDGANGGGLMRNPTGGPNASGGSAGTQGLDPWAAYDTYSPLLDLAPALHGQPLRLVPGDRVIFARLVPGTRPTLQRRAYMPGHDLQSGVQRMGLIVCGEDAPPGPMALRPAAFGPLDASSLLRQWIPFARIVEGVRKLPRLAGVVMPASLQNYFKEFTGDLLSGWVAHTIAPGEQHPGYGTDFAGAVSLTLLRLVGPESDDVKAVLALQLAQLGFDLFSSMMANRQLYAKGGHCAGRMSPTIFAGHLLGFPQLTSARNTLNTYLRQPAGSPRYQEDDAFRMKPMWWSPMLEGCWRFASDSGPRLDGTEWAQPPGSWSDESAPDRHDGWKWALGHYYSQVLSAKPGEVIAMAALDRVAEHGIALHAAVADYMQPCNALREALEPLGCTFGTSWLDNAAAESYRRIYGL